MLSVPGSETMAGDGTDVGIVVIGRNEGERLVRCLMSLQGQGRIVYVDSGSTDTSVARARELGADVVQLDMSVPFTAARSRNAGFRRLRELDPAVAFVQFVDGDCEVDRAWITRATTAFREDPGIAALCGRLVERRPDASVYNRLCQMEWDGPVGAIHSCGGVAMYAVPALVDAGLFREEMIAGEEPELCFRIRTRGGRIVRLDVPMALHDAAMTRLGQWLRRARRGGHAFAECFWLHRAERFRARESARIVAWGLVLPSAALLFAAFALIWPWALIGVAAIAALYAMSLIRVARSQLKRGVRTPDAVLYAAFCTLAKLPEGLGVAQYALNQLVGRHTKLIEYKG